MGTTKSYSIERIPAEVWKKLRIRAIREGLSIRDLFLRWIQNYAEGK